jgi:aminoglycoside phosphotransferase (APT) family kinase protein
VVEIPEAELEIDEPLIRRLLAEQAPALAGLPLRFAAHGWDNDLWRLGDDLLVRLPRRDVAAVLVDHHQRFLPRLAPLVPILVPLPVVAGTATDDYPWPWSVVPWFDGDLAATAPPLPSEAARLGDVLRRLHVDADDDAPRNPFRGVPLDERMPLLARLEESLEPLPDAGTPDAVAAARLVRDAVDLPRATRRVWLHGDLHPRNILVRDGRLLALLDWDDLCGGDPAGDLASVWWLFDVAHHDAFWAAYGDVDLALWQRSRAWAALFGLMFLSFVSPHDGSHDEEAAALARVQLARVHASTPPPSLLPKWPETSAGFRAFGQ